MTLSYLFDVWKEKKKEPEGQTLHNSENIFKGGEKLHLARMVCF